MADTLYSQRPNVSSKQRGGIRRCTLMPGGVFLDGFKNIYRCSLYPVLHGATNFHISIVQLRLLQNNEKKGARESLGEDEATLLQKPTKSHENVCHNCGLFCSLLASRPRDLLPYNLQRRVLQLRITEEY